MATTSPLPPAPITSTRSNARVKPAGKGIEGIITSISKQLATIEKGIDDIYYGNRSRNTGIKIPGTQSKINGILPIVQEVTKIDLCNILTYVLSNVNIRNIAGEDTAVGKKIKRLQSKAKELVADIDSGQISNKFIKDPVKLAKITKTLSEVSNEIDSDVVAAMPQLANAKNYLNDVVGSISQYTTPSLQFTDLNRIPNADVQRVLGKIRGVQSTMYSIATIQSVQDLANVVANAANINIGNQLAQLQKTINPARLLPVFKQIAKTLRSINQILLRILGFIKILQVVNKAITGLLKVLGIIVRILELIPIPNMFTTTAVTQKLSSTLQRVKRFIEDTNKRVEEVAALVELIYNFIVGITAKVTEITLLIDTLIYNLQTCAATADSPIIKDLQEAKGSVIATITRLNTFTTAYAAAQADKTGRQRSYNGFILRIDEEEVVDEGVRYRRRRGIALDSRGVLVAETQLTFATNVDVIYQELILLLQNKGLISDTSLAGETTGLSIDETETPFTDEDTYESVGLKDEEDLLETSADIQAEIGNFIKGIKKGGKKFRRRVRQRLAAFATQSAQQLKQDARSGNFRGLIPQTGGFASNLTSTLKKSTGTGAETASKILSPEVRAKWETVARSRTVSPALRERARQILEQDREARND